MKFKKFMSMMLAIVMVMSMVPSVAFADNQQNAVYRVIFQDYDGTQLDEQEVAQGENADDTTARNKAVREGYEFTSWNKLIDNVQNSFITQAQYRALMCKVIFYDDREQQLGEPQIVQYGSAAREPSGMQKEGYTLNWVDSHQNVVDISEIKKGYEQNEPLELYAKYTAIKCKVEFVDLDGGFITSIYVDYNQTIPNEKRPALPSKKGYDVAWSVNSATKIQENTVVYPKLTEHTYTIRFHANKEGAEDPTDKTVNYTEDANMPIIMMDGYKLSNWNTSSTGNGNAYLPGLDYSKLTPDNTTIDLYAVWEMRTEYTVRYQANNGKTIAAMQNVGYEENNLLPEEIFYEGYTFDGWYTDEGFTSERVTEETAFNQIVQEGHSTVILYAKWLKNHTVTLNTQDGQKPTTVVVPDGRGVPRPSNPSWIGHSFKGWFKDKQCEEESRYDFTTPVTQDIELFAGWEDYFVEVKFIIDNKTTKQIRIQQGNTVAEPEDPIPPEGSDVGFMGWYKDEVCTIPYDFSEIVMEDITLYAKWGEQTSIAEATVTVTPTSFPYTGEEVKPENIIVTLPGILEPLRKDIDYTIAYSNNTDPGSKATITVTGRRLYKDSASTTFTINPPVLNTVTGVKVKATTGNTATIGWTKQTGVTGYKIYIGTAVKTTVMGATKISGIVKGLATGKVYKFKVKSFLRIGTTDYTSKNFSTEVIGVTVPAKVKLSKATSKSKSVTATWAKTNCTKYEIQIATNKNFTKGLKKATANSAAKTATVKSLKKGTIYYVRVRAVTTVKSGKTTITKTGAWSVVKSVKCK